MRKIYTHARISMQATQMVEDVSWANAWIFFTFMLSLILILMVTLIWGVFKVSQFLFTSLFSSDSFVMFRAVLSSQNKSHFSETLLIINCFPLPFNKRCFLWS